MNVQGGWTAERVVDAAARLAHSAPADVLSWALDAHAPEIALGTGLGAEGMVLLDQLARMGRVPRVFMVDSGRLHQETHDLLERIRERYRVTIEVFSPSPAELEPLVRNYGPNLFYRSLELRRLCCRVRKVLPLRRALSGLTAWITGLRRDGATRADVAKVEIDLSNGGLVKINPLADWSANDVWSYIRTHDVPYNALHDQGFPSIGCAPCTRAVAPGEDARAGRWWWEQDGHRECGIHEAPGQPSVAPAMEV